MIKLTKNLVLLACLVLLIATTIFCIPLGARSFAKIDSNSAKAELLMDYNTGQILSEKNATLHLPIASVTKLTTLLLAFEAIERGDLSLEQNLVASEHASSMGGSQVFIDAGAEYKVLDLLHAIIISSANDASVVIAEAIADSEQNFVDLMNKRAKELGARDTNYINCTGLPCATAYSSANDVALIMRQVLTHPLYYEISGIWLEDFTHPSGRITQMANTNKLLKSFSGCDAGKTGSTNEAGYCMSVSAKRGDMRLIAVVLGADNSKARFNKCAELLNYGFNNFITQCVLSSDSDIELNWDIRNAKNMPIVRAEKSFNTIAKRGEEKTYSTEYELDMISAPQTAGSVVGRAIITDNGVVVDKINLVLINDIEAKSVWDNVRNITQNW